MSEQCENCENEAVYRLCDNCLCDKIHEANTIKTTIETMETISEPETSVEGLTEQLRFADSLLRRVCNYSVLLPEGHPLILEINKYLNFHAKADCE